MATDTYALTRRAFQEHLKLCGVPIVFNGKDKQCATGPIWRNNKQEIVAELGESRTVADMLIEDFDALGNIVSNQSVVLIDSLIMAVHAITRDPSDPCVHFIAVGDHASAAIDEGSIPLAIGQAEVSLLFVNVKPTDGHVFTVLYVENLVDPNPIGTFDPVPGERTPIGRRIMLAAAPDTANYILRWQVRS